MTVPVTQVPEVLGLLERHGFFAWAHSGAFSRDGVNFITGVDVSQKEDPAAVQAALDAVD